MTGRLTEDLKNLLPSLGSSETKVRDELIVAHEYLWIKSE